MTRTPPEVPAKPLRGIRRDVRSDDRARWLKGFAWGAFPGTFIGMVVLVVHGPVAGVVVFLVLTLGTGGVAMAVSESAGALVQGVTDPKGRPGPGAHSVVDALVMRGEVEEALTRLRISIESYPDDADARIRVARLLRDEMKDPRAALSAFREGRESECFTVRQMRVSMREMVELARSTGDLDAVLPDLAAHRERFAGTDEAAWAAGVLDELSRPGDASAS